MSIIAKWIAAGLYGLACGHFFRGRYSKAALLFEKICRLTPDEERMELCYSYLGQCYLALGQREKALESLSRAYEPYRIRSQNSEDEFEQREYIKFLRALSDVLSATDLPIRAQEIEREAEEYIAAMLTRRKQEGS